METVNEILGSLTEDHVKIIGYGIIALLAITAVPWVLWHAIKNAPYFIAWVSKWAFITLIAIGIGWWMIVASAAHAEKDTNNVGIEEIENAPKAIIVPE